MPTFEQFVGFGVVGVFLLGAYNTFFAARTNGRNENERRAEPLRLVQDRVVKLEAKVEQLETQSSRHTEAEKLLLSGQLALLRHGIDGNNIEGMRESQE